MPDATYRGTIRAPTRGLIDVRVGRERGRQLGGGAGRARGSERGAGSASRVLARYHTVDERLDGVGRLDEDDERRDEAVRVRKGSQGEVRSSRVA